ncbi:MAG: serine hydrolase, partial [Bacteroidota bacterium]|nr:serine hydrolase [Bacteroidota bacterium]
FNNKIPLLLSSTVEVAHKTGSITNISHDAAIVYLDEGHRYILVILTKDIENPKQAEEIIARISKMIFDAVRKASR